jgi:hypothetical protein
MSWLYGQSHGYGPLFAVGAVAMAVALGVSLFWAGSGRKSEAA